MNQRRIALLLPLLLLIAALIPFIVHADTTVTLTPPTDDAQVDSTDPDTNYGSSGGIYIGSPTAGLVRFDLNSIPTGSIVTSATLKMFNDKCRIGADSFTIYAYRVKAGWSEATVTWNNRPAHEGIATASDSHGVGVWRSWDVTTDVQAFVSGTTNNGWYLEGDTHCQLGSKETIWGTIPKLEVTYVPEMVIPEYALGALLAVAACFAAFVIIKKTHLNLRIK